MGFSSRGLKSLTSVDVIEFYRQTTPHSEIIMDSCILCLNIDIPDGWLREFSLLLKYFTGVFKLK